MILVFTIDTFIIFSRMSFIIPLCCNWRDLVFPTPQSLEEFLSCNLRSSGTVWTVNAINFMLNFGFNSLKPDKMYKTCQGGWWLGWNQCEVFRCSAEYC